MIVPANLESSVVPASAPISSTAQYIGDLSLTFSNSLLQAAKGNAQADNLGGLNASGTRKQRPLGDGLRGIGEGVYNSAAAASFQGTCIPLLQLAVAKFPMQPTSAGAVSSNLGAASEKESADALKRPAGEGTSTAPGLQGNIHDAAIPHGAISESGSGGPFPFKVGSHSAQIESLTPGVRTDDPISRNAGSSAVVADQPVTGKATPFSDLQCRVETPGAELLQSPKEVPLGSAQPSVTGNKPGSVARPAYAANGQVVTSSTAHSTPVSSFDGDTRILLSTSGNRTDSLMQSRIGTALVSNGVPNGSSVLLRNEIPTSAANAAQALIAAESKGSSETGPSAAVGASDQFPGWQTVLAMASCAGAGAGQSVATRQRLHWKKDQPADNIAIAWNESLRGPDLDSFEDFSWQATLRLVPNNYSAWNTSVTEIEAQKVSSSVPDPIPATTKARATAAEEQKSRDQGNVNPGIDPIGSSVPDVVSGQVPKTNLDENSNVAVLRGMHHFPGNARNAEWGLHSDGLTSMEEDAPQPDPTGSASAAWESRLRQFAQVQAPSAPSILSEDVVSQRVTVGIPTRIARASNDSVSSQVPAAPSKELWDADQIASHAPDPEHSAGTAARRPAEQLDAAFQASTSVENLTVAAGHASAATLGAIPTLEQEPAAIGSGNDVRLAHPITLWQALSLVAQQTYSVAGTKVTQVMPQTAPEEDRHPALQASQEIGATAVLATQFSTQRGQGGIVLGSVLQSIPAETPNSGTSRVSPSLAEETKADRGRAAVDPVPVALHKTNSTATEDISSSAVTTSLLDTAEEVAQHDGLKILPKETSGRASGSAPEPAHEEAPDARDASTGKVVVAARQANYSQENIKVPPVLPQTPVSGGATVSRQTLAARGERVGKGIESSTKVENVPVIPESPARKVPSGATLPGALMTAQSVPGKAPLRPLVTMVAESDSKPGPTQTDSEVAQTGPASALVAGVKSPSPNHADPNRTSVYAAAPLTSFAEDPTSNQGDAQVDPNAPPFTELNLPGPSGQPVSPIVEVDQIAGRTALGARLPILPKDLAFAAASSPSGRPLASSVCGRKQGLTSIGGDASGEAEPVQRGSRKSAPSEGSQNTSSPRGQSDDNEASQGNQAVILQPATASHPTTEAVHIQEAVVAPRGDSSANGNAAGHSATNLASQAPASTPASVPASTVSAARLIQNMSQTEIRLGMRSAEFGNISISTSATREMVSAQIVLNHSELAKALATHLPDMQSRLGSGQALEVRIDVNGDKSGQGSAISGGMSDSHASQARSGRQNVGCPTNGKTGRGLAEVTSLSAGHSASTSGTTTYLRLDVRV